MVFILFPYFYICGLLVCCAGGFRVFDFASVRLIIVFVSCEMPAACPMVCLSLLAAMGAMVAGLPVGFWGVVGVLPVGFWGVVGVLPVGF